MKTDKFYRSCFLTFSLALVVTLLLPSKTFGQEPAASVSTASETKFRFGIHASPNISWISTKDDEVEPSANVKFGFGLLAIFNFTENYAISSGINIVSRGGELLTEPDPIQYKGDYASQFLQIPIQLRMSTREFGYNTFFATFGGSVDLRLSEEINIEPELPDPLDSYVKFFNAMFIIGAGMEYNLGGNTSVVGGIYYHRSLIDNLIEDDNHLLVNNSSVYRFDYVSLQLGILF